MSEYKRIICFVGMAIGLFSSAAHPAFIADLGQGASGHQAVTTGLSVGTYNDYYTFTTDVATNNVAFNFTVDSFNASWFQAGSISFNLYEDQTTPLGTPIASAVTGGGVSNIGFLADLAASKAYVLQTQYSFNLVGGDGYNSLSVGPFGDPEYCPPETPPVSAVPLPAAAWLFGSGVLGLITVARRKPRNE